MNEVWPAMYSAAARPWRCRAAPAKNRIWSTIGGISSSMVSWKGFPVFSDSARTRSSALASSASAMRISARLRSEGVVRRHEAKASAATRSARSTSAGPETGASANGSPVLGSIEGRRGPVLGVPIGPSDEVLQLAHAAPFTTWPVDYRITDDPFVNKRFRNI